MFKKILIIGCGLIGSSILRAIKHKKLSKKIFIFEKSKKNLSKIKKLKLPGIIIKKPEDVMSEINMIIFCTPMSEYKKIILKLNKSLTKNHIITDVGSSKSNSLKMIKILISFFDNMVSQFSGDAQLSIIFKNFFELLCTVFIDYFSCTQFTFCIHPHVQRPF